MVAPVARPYDTRTDIELAASEGAEEARAVAAVTGSAKFFRMWTNATELGISAGNPAPLAASTSVTFRTTVIPEYWIIHVGPVSAAGVVTIAMSGADVITIATAGSGNTIKVPGVPGQDDVTINNISGSAGVYFTVFAVSGYDANIF